MKLFDKYFHPENFAFAGRFDGRALWVKHQGFSLCVEHGPGIHYLQVRHDRLWPHDYRCERFEIPSSGSTDDDRRQSMHISPDAGLRLGSDTGETVLEAGDGTWFGVSGQSWMFRFQLRPGMQFYGLGEKHTPFERSNRRYQFRNTDVWADHPAHRVMHDDYDPDYLSIPYLIIKQDNTYIGLLLDTPYPCQIAIGPAAAMAAGQLDVALSAAPCITLGAQNGPAALYFVAGPSLPELTRTFQKLVGPTPLPPIWALGYHQCRWGYKGHADLVELADHFERLRFPADGQGGVDHDAYHNQYALLMARATHAAMLEARPAQRPFLLSRAGCTGSQRYCAHWTGDNYSSYRHLHRSIAKSVNLALSGVAFNGPDMGGFGGDCGEALIVDWFKAAFLFPFFRNHSMHGSRAQEPWAYSKDAMMLLRHYVRLRYRLLPYLYNLFIDQEERGEAVLRPLFYDFGDTPEHVLALIDDQFMVGPHLMHAPFVHEKQSHREVALPDAQWLRADNGRWLEGGRRVRVRRDKRSTPLFLRAGGLIPFQQEVPTTNRCDLNRIGLLCCLPAAFSGRAHGRYRADDGISFDYRQGHRTVLEITAGIDGRDLLMTVRTRTDGFGTIDLTPYTFQRFKNVYLESDGTLTSLRPVKTAMQLTGRPLSCYRWDTG